MVSNLVVRNKRTGYVTFVAKARVDGESRTVEYICGLGNMTQEEFKHFQTWAHSIKDQRMRRDRVLACPMVAEEGKIVKGKVATAAQKKTTVKRAAKKIVTKAKIRQPVSMEGYKGLSRGMTHTEIMMERIRDEKARQRLKEYQKLHDPHKKWVSKTHFESGMGK